MLTLLSAEGSQRVIDKFSALEAYLAARKSIGSDREASEAALSIQTVPVQFGGKSVTLLPVKLDQTGDTYIDVMDTIEVGANGSISDPDPDPTPTPTVSLEEFAAEVLTLVNAERVAAGLSELTTTSALSSAAAIRAAELEVSFSHDRPDGRSPFTALDEAGVSYGAAGENIAFGYGTPQSVMNGWMNSSGHKANILHSNYSKIGIGIHKSAKGTLHWVQLFTD